MLTLNQIREDLMDIRYYFICKKLIDEVSNTIRNDNLVRKVNVYNEVMKKSSSKDYVLYTCLYIKGLTQEATAEVLGFSCDYIQRMHKKLLLFLQKNINGVVYLE